jgi:hypothetical protein
MKKLLFNGVVSKLPLQYGGMSSIHMLPYGLLHTIKYQNDIMTMQAQHKNLHYVINGIYDDNKNDKLKTYDESWTCSIPQDLLPVNKESVFTFYFAKDSSFYYHRTIIKKEIFKRPVDNQLFTVLEEEFGVKNISDLLIAPCNDIDGTYYFGSGYVEMH